MEHLEGTVTMPLVTYQKLRNDVSQIFGPHGTEWDSEDKKAGIHFRLNEEKVFELAWEEMIRRGIDVSKYDKTKAKCELGFIVFGFMER